MVKGRRLRISNICGNIALAVFFLAVFFGAAEFACRLWYHPAQDPGKFIFEYDEEKIYRLKKNLKDGEFAGKPVETNSFGYRSPQIPIEKGRGVVRILVVGDSISFGHAVGADDAYPRVLERLLNRKNKKSRFEVINTAVPGNSPFQEYIDLKRGLAFSPDIVIIQFALNDVIEPYLVCRKYGGSKSDYHEMTGWCRWHYFLREKSRFYLFLSRAAAKIRFGVFGDKALPYEALQREVELCEKADSLALDDKKLRSARQECFQWLQKEVRLCRENGIGCILMVSPARFQFFGPAQSRTQEMLRDFARRNDMGYLELLGLLEDEARREAGVDGRERVWKRYFMDYDHYTPAGHIFAAEALYPMVEEWLGSRQAP